VIVVAILIAGIGIALVTSGGDDENADDTTTTTEQSTTTGSESTTTSDSTTTTDDSTTTSDDSTTTDETIDDSGGPLTETGEVGPGETFILEVTVAEPTATLNVSPTSDWDLVLVVNGGEYTDHEVDQSFNDEEIELAQGDYEVTIKGYDETQGGSFTATLL